MSTPKFNRPEIDGLRAIAIVAVIGNHFDKRLFQSGYLGVDLFFVISGYVITASLARRHVTDFKDSGLDSWEGGFSVCYRPCWSLWLWYAWLRGCSIPIQE
jgi:hypothetical protein